jgi:hypothetical protein
VVAEPVDDKDDGDVDDKDDGDESVADVVTPEVEDASYGGASAGVGAGVVPGGVVGVSSETGE